MRPVQLFASRASVCGNKTSISVCLTSQTRCLSVCLCEVFAGRLEERKKDRKRKAGGGATELEVDEGNGERQTDGEKVSEVKVGEEESSGCDVL